MAGRKPVVSDEEIIQVFREHEDTMLATGDVAEALPIGSKGVLVRLKELEEEGRLKNRHFGNQIIWALADDVS